MFKTRCHEIQQDWVQFLVLSLPEKWSWASDLLPLAPRLCLPFSPSPLKCSFLRQLSDVSILDQFHTLQAPVTSENVEPLIQK